VDTKPWATMHMKSFQIGLLVLLILAVCKGEGPCGKQAGQEAEQRYTNAQYGYTVWYPRTWFPSGIVYGNAFEIRNYEPHNPQARAPQDRASLLILDVPMESPEAAQQFLDNLLAQEENPERKVIALTIAGHQAVRVQQQLKAQEPGPGVIRRSPVSPSTPGLAIWVHLSTYIVNSSYVLHLWGRVPVGADPAVVEELIQIQDNVTFAKEE
jgi:hypothetical protein